MKIQSSSGLWEKSYDAVEFCSTKEAAKMLGVSHRTIQLWVESGVLQAWKTAGGHRRIAVSSINRLVDERNQAISTAPADTGTSLERKILLVDDDTTLLRLYELEIGDWSIPLNVIQASNGFEALIKIGESKPDLMISDLTMPGMDGSRMIRTLRSDKSYNNMPIIVISGLDRATIKSMSLPEDIPVFSKPVPLGELRKAVEKLLRGAG